MRQGGVLTDLYTGLAGEAKLSVSRSNQILYLLLCHAFAQRVIDGFVRGQRYLVSQTHQRDLVRALDPAATRSDGGRASKRDLRSGLGNSIGEEEAHRFFDPQPAAAHAAFFKALRHALVGAFVFLPGAHIRILAVGRAGDLLARAAFFKCRAHIECRAFGWQNQREQAFASPPTNTGEVAQ